MHAAEPGKKERDATRRRETMEVRSGKGRKTSTHLSLIVMQVAAFKVGRGAFIDEEPTATCHVQPAHQPSTCHVQPFQRRRASGLDCNDRSKPPLGIENNGPRLFRFDCQGATDGKRAGQVVCARGQHNPVDGTVVSSCKELLGCDRVR